ncbi:MAG: aldehyde ferredoxin oxidoreductase family protein [Bacillota bacterium]|nr:aldehyde ferredoxin oxidoreductase family protein [Bacillota bacterium]
MDCLKGKLLEINLSSGQTRVRDIDDKVQKLFFGGRSLGAKLLYDELMKGVEPLSPDNKLFVLTGPVTGTIVPNAGKYVVVTKSPLTGAFLDSYASGLISAQIRFAGYDGLLISGKAEKPVYIWIKDDQVEIRDAGHLWGKDTIESEDLIKEETEDQAGVMVIGPAGEKMVRIASINSDHYRQAGRGGGGAVMGYKNLKGIAVFGTGDVIPHDGKKLQKKYEEDLSKLLSSDVGVARKRFGTPLTLTITNKAGMLPVNNFQKCTFPEAVDQIDGLGVEKSTIKTRACWGCMVACSKITKVIEEGPYEGDEVEGPEYETLSILGSNLGIATLPPIIRANILCDRLGIDTISAGVVIAFVMECYQRDLLSEDEIGVKNPAFGNDAAVMELIEMIAYRRGFGDKMAEGTLRLAEVVGKGSSVFAMHVKGMEFPGYEPRAAFGACLSYAVSPRGACHRRAWPPAKEVLGGYPPFTTEGKAEIVRDLYNENGILHSLLVCDFPAKFIPLNMADYAEYVTYACGMETTREDLQQMTERGETMIRMFNNREGFTRDDDTLPARILEETLSDGPNPGQRFTKADLDFMIDEYYALRGWDSKGTPLPETLKKLGIEDQGRALK